MIWNNIKASEMQFYHVVKKVNVGLGSSFEQTAMDPKLKIRFQRQRQFDSRGNLKKFYHIQGYVTKIPRKTLLFSTD